MGQMTKQDQSTNPRRTNVLKPRILSMPEPGKYLLGGNTKLVRNIQDYKAILRKISSANVTDPFLCGRRLCGLLMRQEFSQEELATKNVTGVSRNTTHHIPIAKLDPVIMEAIFEQAQYQFPEVDFMTDKGRRKKILSYLNAICKDTRPRRDKFKTMSN